MGSLITDRDRPFQSPRLTGMAFVAVFLSADLPKHGNKQNKSKTNPLEVISHLSGFLSKLASGRENYFFE